MVFAETKSLKGFFKIVSSFEHNQMKQTFLYHSVCWNEYPYYAFIKSIDHRESLNWTNLFAFGRYCALWLNRPLSIPISYSYGTSDISFNRCEFCKENLSNLISLDQLYFLCRSSLVAPLWNRYIGFTWWLNWVKSHDTKHISKID